MVHWTVIGQVAEGLEGLPPLPPVNSLAASTLGDGSVQPPRRDRRRRRRPALVDPESARVVGRTMVQSRPNPTRPAGRARCRDGGLRNRLRDRCSYPAARPAFSAGWIGPAVPVDGLQLQPDCSLAAISRDLRSIDVFAVKPDGTLAAITRSPEVGAALIGAQSQHNHSALIIHNATWFVSTQALPMGFISG